MNGSVREDEKMFCRNCGYKINDNAQFCINCGVKVVQAPADKPDGPRVSTPASSSAAAAPAPAKATIAQAPITVSKPMPAAPAANITPVFPKPKAKKKKTALIIVLSLAALLLIGVVLGGIFVIRGLQDGTLDFLNSGTDSTKKSKKAVIEDGILSYDGMKIDFGDNDVPKNAGEAASAADLGDEEPPDGLGSTLYDLYIDAAAKEPITISIPITEDLSDLEKDAKPMIAIGTIVTFEDGRQSTVYHYLEADVKDDTATASFIPSDILGGTFVRGASDGTSSAGTTVSAAPGKEHVRAGIIWCTTTFSEGGHFLVYFPAQAGKFFIDYNNREALLTDLEGVYDQYLAMGYQYAGRSSWPMEVDIRNSNDEAAYTFGLRSAEGSIEINRKFFENGTYNSAEVKALLAHEFFHFVQMNYVSSFNQCPWFDEATATYFESVQRGSIPSIVGQYKENIFSGVFPENNTSANGYARMPLIAYLVSQAGGSEAFIQQAYTAAGSGTDWAAAISTATGDPSLWAGDFYSALIRGEVGDYTPYTIHSNLAKGSLKETGTALALTVPSAEEIAAAAENDEAPSLGSASLTIAAYGAQCVALTIDADNLKLLADGMDPVVKVSPGADARVFAIKGSAVTEYTAADGKIPLTDFKKASGEKTVFLVLVTGLHAAGTQEYTVTVEMQQYPTLDELVGRYEDGSVTIDEVFISDALREQMTAAADAGTQAGDNSDNPLGDVGCDADTLAAIEAMVGQVQPSILVIEKTGEDTGTLTMNSAPTADQGEQAGTPMAFVYKDGVMTFDYNAQGSIVKGTINAKYGPNKTVVLDGGLRSTIESIPESDLYFDVSVAGTKPIEVP